MISSYKPPLTVKKMTEHLAKSKRVVFNDISEQEAQEILYTHNYINVISPFKYRFAKKNKKGLTIKDKNGNHIYERDVDFKEYYDLYVAERNKYPKLFRSISCFEQLFSSVVSYEVLNAYCLKDPAAFSNFISILRGNINSSQYKETVKNHNRDVVDNLEKSIEEYGNPYVVFDTLSLHSLLAILVSLDDGPKHRCIEEITKRQSIVKADDEKTFYDQVSKIIRIRNCICHNDSLEILLRYLSRRHKTLRTSSDKYSYAKMIEKIQSEQWD